MLPLYGLAESGDYWYETLTRFTMQQCKFQQSACDLALFIRHAGRRLIGLSGHHIDDLVRGAPADHRLAMEAELSQRFESKTLQNLPAEFPGTGIWAYEHDGYYVQTKKYVSRLMTLPDNATYRQYTSARPSLLWLVNSRPDVDAFASLVSCITPSTYTQADSKDLNEKIVFLKRTIHIALRFPKLDVNSLKLVCSVYAGFANRKDKVRQIGYIISDEARTVDRMAARPVLYLRQAGSKTRPVVLPSCLTVRVAHRVWHIES